MSVLNHIGRDIPKKLITAVLRPGEGQRLVGEMAQMPGVLSISHHHARGVGSRRVRAGQLYFSENDVLIVLAESEQADTIFSHVYEAGKLFEPGAGMVFVENILRGHPLMPLDLADW
jgi:nitrogen regulatory protein PII